MEVKANVFNVADYFKNEGNRIALAPNLSIGPEVVIRPVATAEMVVRCTECHSTAGCNHVDWASLEEAGVPE